MLIMIDGHRMIVPQRMVDKAFSKIGLGYITPNDGVYYIRTRRGTKYGPVYHIGTAKEKALIFWLPKNYKGIKKERKEN